MSVKSMYNSIADFLDDTHVQARICDIALIGLLAYSAYCAYDKFVNENPDYYPEKKKTDYKIKKPETIGKNYISLNDYLKD